MEDPSLYITRADDWYPLAGLVAMENWATWNQHLLLASPAVAVDTRLALQEELIYRRGPDYLAEAVEKVWL